MLYKVTSGTTTKSYDENDIKDAVGKFISSCRATEIGMMIEVTYIENKQEVHRYGPTEQTIKKLGMWSKFEKKLKEAKENYTKTKKIDV